MASGIFPPGTTMLFARDMNEPTIIDNRYGKSMPRGSANRITVRDSSGVGIQLAMNGLDVSTTGTRSELMWVLVDCGEV